MEREGKSYHVELDDAAERDFDKLTTKAKGQIAKLIDTLAVDPRPETYGNWLASKDYIVNVRVITG